MNRKLIRKFINKNIRKESIAEALSIIDICNELELHQLISCLENDSIASGQTFYIELDFLKTRFVYFNQMPVGKGDFGMELSDIPDLVEKWRGSKIDRLI